MFIGCVFFFSSRRRHTRLQGDWSSDVCSSDLGRLFPLAAKAQGRGFLGPRGLARRPQVEIVFRQVNPAALFSNEGVRMTVFAAGAAGRYMGGGGRAGSREAFVVRGVGGVIDGPGAGVLWG